METTEHGEPRTMAPRSGDRPGPLARVVSGGFCIGCGACSALDPAIGMRLDAFGRFIAELPEGKDPSLEAGRACPFADGVADEDVLARERFGEEMPKDGHVGCHIASYAGWVEEPGFRSGGSSGGMTSWMLVELLEAGMVDHVVHVIPTPRSPAGAPLFRFAISSNAAEVRAGAKSRYYPVEMSGVIRGMRERPGRYAVVGIPCFIKALRLVARQSPVVRERLVFTIGLVCGHLKSTAFAESAAWQCGIPPGKLGSIDFRTKRCDQPASRYAVTVSGERDGEAVTATRPTAELFGSNWGHGFFKYKACDFCDDVLAETADVVFGDAWLPEFERDGRGTNIVVVRNAEIGRLLEAGKAAGRLHLHHLPLAKVVESQAGGFRHRRDGLRYRLHLEDQAGRWRPTKRFAASAGHLSGRLRRIHRIRLELGQASHEAFRAAKAQNDFGVFRRLMDPLVARYERCYRPTLGVRVLRRLARAAASLFRRDGNASAGAPANPL